MEIFRSYVRKNLGIILSDRQIEQFIAYEQLLLEWNTKINLTSITEPHNIHIKHFYDSITCMKVIPSSGKYSLIDVGTGAGFPGIPLKIVNPSIQLTLVESIGKKTNFCKTAVENLQLSNINIITARAESIGHELLFRETFDWAVARAVAPLSTLVEYLLPLVRIGGNALIQKGTAVEKELNQSLKAIWILGGEIKKTITITLPENMGGRRLIHIIKTRLTPEIFPRRPGIPKRKPLA
ncbi:MAG: 16S rRNA (guanine(527)-N(7))-methyltransferase RsmG [Anaerolineaceae bacterium]|nr:16S rRNA (guanine(527)-N(7))-methyltransferase RsmG [Anaerolineaceae bacterium]